jgi:hypothetical protein
MDISQDETNNFSAVERHIEYQLWRFNKAPVLGNRGERSEGELKGIQCSLKDIYVPLDCGLLEWGEILKMQKVDNRIGRRETPFDESAGGRAPILDQVLQLLGNRNFRDAIVVQGIAGAGKSGFTLSLCVELRRLGLRPIRIRMRDLALDSRISLLEDLAQAIGRNSGDDDFNVSRNAPPPASKPLDISYLFDETVEFGSARICPHIFILDGWDEISVSASEGFRQRIEETLRAIRREISGRNGVRVVLTGRPSLDVEESRFLLSTTPVLTIRPFTRLQLTIFSEALLTYRVTIDDADASILRERIRKLVRRSDSGSDKAGNIDASDGDEDGGLGILGLPLLALLAIWLSLNNAATPLALGRDRTTLYRRLVDMTCRHGASVEEFAAGPRIVGDKLRALLRRTAAAMTMRGTENISYRELERRLKESANPELDYSIREVMKKNPIANLMISFFFNVGSRDHGCEFIHKSFREYLFAECVVETLKSLSAPAAETSRTPYWREFNDGDRRRLAVRRLAPLLAFQWLTPDVHHLTSLLAWEIDRGSEGVEAE